MNNAVASKVLAAAELSICTECHVGETDDSWCNWCHFWIQLSFERQYVQERVMESTWSAIRFADAIGIEVA